MAVAGNGGAAAPRSTARTGVFVGATAADRNPLGQTPLFFHRLLQLVAARRMDITATERILAPGFIRRWWARTENALAAPPAFSWARDSFDTCTPATAAVSTPRRYLTANLSILDGNQLSNPDDRAAVGFSRHAGQPPLIRAGQQQGRPTIRSRITSFGSRVPAVNNPYPAEQVPGG